MTDVQIRTQIAAAVATGKHSLHISGDYDIFDTIILPSDFTLILEDCCLRLADGVATHIFRNAACKPGVPMTTADRDHDIRIIGIGRAILDGGEYNGLSEKNSCQDGRPHISQNNMLLFSNVSGFTVTGLQVRHQRWWALNFLYCDRGTIRDIDFCSDDTRIDENGNRVHGFYQGCYRSIYIKNADGIDIRSGCHDILIENITGFCEDDIVALTNLPGDLEDKLYCVSDATRDLYNIVIRNIRGSSFCSMIRLLNQTAGARLYNVLIDGVFDDSKDSAHLDRGNMAFNIGDTHQYGLSEIAEDAICDVMIRNVYVRGLSAIRLAGAMKNVQTENIVTFDGCETKFLDCRNQQ